MADEPTSVVNREVSETSRWLIGLFLVILVTASAFFVHQVSGNSADKATTDHNDNGYSHPQLTEKWEEKLDDKFEAQTTKSLTAIAEIQGE